MAKPALTVGFPLARRPIFTFNLSAAIRTRCTTIRAGVRHAIAIIVQAVTAIVLAIIIAGIVLIFAIFVIGVCPTCGTVGVIVTSFAVRTFGVHAISRLVNMMIAFVAVDFTVLIRGIG